MKPIVSILMSIYNENEQYIRESVSSILSQSIKDIELVIIVDNPDRSDVPTILQSFNDDRIIFHVNSENIGLALSMNKAAELASPEVDIFARMDADDIAFAQRLEKCVPFILNGKYDFVFSQFHYINETSMVIPAPLNRVYPDECLNRIISLQPSIIHHPTVMFTKQIFNRVRGYRDFPCSQDADLWLRMAEAGCRFHMIREPLLYYRINSCSVTMTKWFRQRLTCNYIFKLSIERLKTGQDSYSKSNYEEYLLNHGIQDANKEQKLRVCYRDLSKAIEYRQKGYKLQYCLIRIKVFIKSNILRNYYISLIEKRIIMNFKFKNKLIYNNLYCLIY